MGIGTSLVVFAVGAILRFAVTVHTTGFNVHTIGVILMIVGVVGLVSIRHFLGFVGRLPYVPSIPNCPAGRATTVVDERSQY